MEIVEGISLEFFFAVVTNKTLRNVSLGAVLLKKLINLYFLCFCFNITLVFNMAYF